MAGGTRETIGGIFAGVAGLLVVASFFAIYGDTFPTHVGMSKDNSGAVVVHFASCPGELVKEIEIHTYSTPKLVWRVTGPGSYVDTWAVADQPPNGLVTEQAPDDGSLPSGDVEVRIVTNQRKWFGDFTIEELPAVGIAFDYEVRDLNTFASAALHRYPCGDPAGRKAGTRWFLRLLAAAAVSGSVAAVLLRSRRPPVTSGE